MDSTRIILWRDNHGAIEYELDDKTTKQLKEALTAYLDTGDEGCADELIDLCNNL